MRIHNVIIITSGTSQPTAPARLERWIEDYRTAGKKVILVFGPDGDDFLIGCRRVEDCEIVFDPNFQGGFFSGVKAGLHAVHSPALILSLATADLRPLDCLTIFESSVRGDGSALHGDVVLTRDDHASQGPFLVSQKGVARLRDLPSTLQWPDANRVQIETLPPAPSTDTRLA